MTYNPSRGGHAPGHLRDAFVEYLDSEQYQDGKLDITVLVGEEEREKPLRWLLGQLWNCTDIMPSEVCSIVDLRAGSTYAMGVRKVATEVT